LLRAFTQKPESSAKHGILKFSKPNFDLIFAFCAKEQPFSKGSLTFLKLFKFCIFIFLDLKI